MPNFLQGRRLFERSTVKGKNFLEGWSGREIVLGNFSTLIWTTVALRPTLLAVDTDESF